MWRKVIFRLALSALSCEKLLPIFVKKEKFNGLEGVRFPPLITK